MVEINQPWRIAVSPFYIAILTDEDGLVLASRSGHVIKKLPGCKNCSCAAFYPTNLNMLALGFKNGKVRLWDVQNHRQISEFQGHPSFLTSACFAPDGRLFLSSLQYVALILTLDDTFHVASQVVLKGHQLWVTGIHYVASLNQCITCSVDCSIKAWDCQTGACLRTVNQHSDYIKALALHPSGQHFASGSTDQSVIVWACETFEVLLRINFANPISSLVFGDGDLLYVGVDDQGVMSCNTVTGAIGPVVIPAVGGTTDLVLCMLLLVRGRYFTNLMFACVCCSAFTQPLDFLGTCAVAVVCPIQRTHGCGCTVEGLQAESAHVPAARACGSHSAMYMPVL
jgi:WD40 repeat protein